MGIESPSIAEECRGWIICQFGVQSRCGLLNYFCGGPISSPVFLSALWIDRKFLSRAPSVQITVQSPDYSISNPCVDHSGVMPCVTSCRQTPEGPQANRTMYVEARVTPQKVQAVRSQWQPRIGAVCSYENRLCIDTVAFPYEASPASASLAALECIVGRSTRGGASAIEPYEAITASRASYAASVTEGQEQRPFVKRRDNVHRLKLLFGPCQPTRICTGWQDISGMYRRPQTGALGKYW